MSVRLSFEFPIKPINRWDRCSPLASCFAITHQHQKKHLQYSNYYFVDFFCGRYINFAFTRLRLSVIQVSVCKFLHKFSFLPSQDLFFHYFIFLIDYCALLHSVEQASEKPPLTSFVKDTNFVLLYKQERCSFRDRSFNTFSLCLSLFSFHSSNNNYYFTYTFVTRILKARSFSISTL